MSKKSLEFIDSFPRVHATQPTNSVIIDRYLYTRKEVLSYRKKEKVIIAMSSLGHWPLLEVILGYKVKHNFVLGVLGHSGVTLRPIVRDCISKELAGIVEGDSCYGAGSGVKDYRINVRTRGKWKGGGGGRTFKSATLILIPVKYGAIGT